MPGIIGFLLKMEQVTRIILTERRITQKQPAGQTPNTHFGSISCLFGEQFRCGSLSAETLKAELYMSITYLKNDRPQ